MESGEDLDGDGEVLFSVVIWGGSMYTFKDVTKAGKRGHGRVWQASTDLEIAESTNIDSDCPPSYSLGHHGCKPAEGILGE